MNSSNLSPVSKAIAGGVAALVIAFLARYNVHLGDEFPGALETLINAVLAYLIGYVTVYLAPRNRE